MRNLSRSCVILALVSANLVNAQPAPPSSGEAKPGKVSRFDDSFVDEGNAGAKQLAAERGIGVGEATRQLRLMHSAGRTGARLVRDNAATFAGVMVENGRI